MEHEWEEEHGYSQYRCSKCGRLFWDDGSPSCPAGCGDDNQDEDEVDPEELPDLWEEK